MKIKIRRGCFETNSSSEHSLAVLNEEILRKWMQGDVCYNEGNKEFEDVKNSMPYDTYSFNEYISMGKESFVDYFTTPKGEEIAVVGYYTCL